MMVALVPPHLTFNLELKTSERFLADHSAQSNKYILFSFMNQLSINKQGTHVAENLRISRMATGSSRPRQPDPKLTIPAQ